MPYAIARLKKLKRGSIAGSAAHSARLRETLNANPNQENIRFIGSNDPNESLEDLVLAKIGSVEQKRKIRTDAVYCVEFLLSASPSYFRPDCPTVAGYYEPTRLNDWLEATHEWLAFKYSDRIVRAELHLDEATPHVHAYFVPLDEQGQLRCNHFFDGREKIQKFQDSYYDTMRLIGLSRGIKGSRAQHQDIKDFYRIVEQGRDLEIDELNSEQLKAKAADRDRALSRKEEMERTASALLCSNEQLQKRIAVLETQVQQLHDLPTKDVAWELGLNSISTAGSAIDLVMHVNECDQRQAISWLYQRFGKAGAQRAAIAHTLLEVDKIIELEPPIQFTLPVEDKSNWQEVCDYFTHEWSITENLVEALYNRGLVYADSQKNAVLVMRNLDGQANGAFVQGTRTQFNGYIKGTQRREGWYYFHLGGQPTDTVEKLVLCQSPVEAMSIAMLEYHNHKDVPPTRTLYMAVDSPKSLPVQRLQNIPNVLVAFESNAAAQAFKELLPQAKRIKCDRMEWNQQPRNYSKQLKQQPKGEEDLSL